MNGEAWSVRVEGLSKKFGLSLRRSMRYGFADSLRRLSGRRVDTTALRPGEFWAVQDVSFSLAPGESLGIMGVNGSGKTTLLRMLTGVYKPDSGEARLRGRVGALIAAGAGFAPMLSGRENVFVSGALLGMSQAEIRARLDEIVAFAELEQFMDMPVKHYSSGMFVRLGFAVAAMSRPQVLIVDEVLAVGDLNFQKKCYDYLFGLKKQGTSIVLVSHSIGAIWAVCDRGLFLDKGRVAFAGVVEDVIRHYDETNARNALASRSRVQAAEAAAGIENPVAEDSGEAATLPSDYGHTRGGTGEAWIEDVVIADTKGSPTGELNFEQGFQINARVHVARAIDEPLLRFAIDAMHYRFICVIDSLEQGLSIGRLEPGSYAFSVLIPDQNFRPGAYSINCGIVARRAGVHVYYAFAVAKFTVQHPRVQFLYADDNAVMHLKASCALSPAIAPERV